ncbi:MAG: 50S ribosomal protein L17 [Deltaproteobacteria bacterium]|nr:MAG: 50S ribosomal protein L17 [Deltaproteobacteria bacterium]
MRHRKAGVKLNRTSSHRKAMFRNMVTSLIKYGKIRTTDAKAKEVRRWADKVVTLAKRGDLHARRQALSIITESAVVKKLFDEAPERFGGIAGGYTRVIKLGCRPGDAASMSLVEFVSAEDRKPKKPVKKAKRVEADSNVAKSKSVDEPKKTETEKDDQDSAVDGLKSPDDGVDQPSEVEGKVDSTASAGEPDSNPDFETTAADEVKPTKE